MPIRSDIKSEVKPDLGSINKMESMINRPSIKSRKEVPVRNSYKDESQGNVKVETNR